MDELFNICSVIPECYERITFSDLVISAEYKTKYILGRIIQLWPIQKRCSSGYLRKFLLSDAFATERESSKKLLSVFVFDNLAKDSQSAEEGGFLAVSNFIVENLTAFVEDPEQSNLLPIQILAMPGAENADKPSIWIARIVAAPNQPTDGRKSPVAQKTPRKKNVVMPTGPVDESPTRSYQYVTLNELSESTNECPYFHIYGIVESCRLQTRSASSVQSLSFQLCDFTKSKFHCVVYRKNDPAFPDVHPGDVVRIHRLRVQKFRGVLKGTCASSKFVVVFSSESRELEPKSSANTFVFTDDDKERVIELFKWAEEQKKPILICDIKPNKDVSIICQVIGVYLTKADSVVVKIWDGTRNANYPCKHLGLEREVIDQALFSIAKPYFVTLFVYGNHCLVAGDLKPSQYILVRHAYLNCDQNDASSGPRLILPTSYKKDRGIFVLNPEDPEVQDLKNRLEKITEETLEQRKEEELLDTAESFFLDCDISVPTSRNGVSDVHPAPSQAAQPEVADTVDNSVISIVDAAVLPGQSTQEFGGRYEEINIRRQQQLKAASRDHVTSNGSASSLEQSNMPRHTVFQSSSQPPNQDLGQQVSSSSVDVPEHEWWKNITDRVSVPEGHCHIKPTSLSEVSASIVPNKFRVIASVFDCSPKTDSICKLIRLYCPQCYYLSKDAKPNLESSVTQSGLPIFFCPECGKRSSKTNKGPMLEYTFLIEFTLQDGPVSQFPGVFLWQKHAVKFFKGITPEEALQNKDIADSIFKMLWTVCWNSHPVGANFDDLLECTFYPIIDCCIMSYTAGGLTRYQIFNTVLI